MPPALAGIFGAEECVQERQRQSDDVDHGYEASTRHLPERRPGDVLAPEGLPSCNGCAVDAEEPRKLADSARCRSLPHRGDQDDDDTKVDLPAEKTHRRRCYTLSASVAIAAEAEPVATLIGQMIEAAPGCSRVVGTMQSTAVRAWLPPSAFG